MRRRASGCAIRFFMRTLVVGRMFANEEQPSKSGTIKQQHVALTLLLLFTFLALGLRFPNTTTREWATFNPYSGIRQKRAVTISLPPYLGCSSTPFGVHLLDRVTPCRSSGPGGQSVNTADTRVQMSFRCRAGFEWQSGN